MDEPKPGTLEWLRERVLYMENLMHRMEFSEKSVNYKIPGPITKAEYETLRIALWAWKNKIYDLEKEAMKNESV